jgi:RNA polymerase sigma factor (sigma-70 family)
LHELILNAVEKNDEKSKLLILEKFNKTIKYYARKLNYYCAETDLIIFMLILINKLDLKKIKNFKETNAVKYINGSIKYEYIRLSKKNSYINSHEILIDTDIIDYIDNDNDKEELSTESSEFIKYMDEILIGNQRKVFLYFLNGYSVTEISKLTGISRQAVGKIKKRIALKFIDEYKKYNNY